MSDIQLPLASLLHPSLIRAYDVRGIVGETLFVQDAYHIGKALGHYIHQHHSTPLVCIGYDGRISSPILTQSFVHGLLEEGAHVLRIPLGPTPMLYFTTHITDAVAGVMVTGSHNPHHHNGFKFVHNQRPWYGDALKTMIEGYDCAHRCAVQGQEMDSSHYPAIPEAYVRTLLAAVRKGRPLKMVWDAGNGAAADIIKQLCQHLEGHHILMHTVIDGTFPGRSPDPTIPEHLIPLINVVRQHHCDLGVAFDGDGDRMIAVDNQGRIVSGDHLMMMLAQDVLSRHPGAVIIADVKTSQAFFDYVATLGGKPLMWKTGHSHIKTKMYEQGALFAGEMSGHLFFADDYYGYDDGLYAAIRLMNILAAQPTSFSERLDQLPRMCTTPEIRIPCDDTRKFEIVEEVKHRLHGASVPFVDIDGLRVQSQEGWWLLRVSHTQAALVMRCEAASSKGLARIKQMLHEQLQQSCVASPLFEHPESSL